MLNVTLQFSPKPTEPGETVPKGASFNYNGEKDIVVDAIKASLKAEHLNKYFVSYSVDGEDNVTNAEVGQEIINILKPPA